ncbi:MAG: MFS transporter [Actinomycetota bacterium]|nr:MFS transporter [Actinomycetota bacterium]
MTAAQPQMRGTERRTGPLAAARLVRTRNFGPYFVGNAVSASGTWFHNLAAAILVYRLTGSEVLLGVLNFGQFLPVLVLAPWAGAAADRFDRRRLVLVTQLVATALAATLALLAWTAAATPAVVILFSLALGVTSAFAAPAAQALITSLVAADDLASAVGLNSMTYNIARAVGPALAAATVATLGIPEAFALNSISYLALVAGLLVVRPRRAERARRTALADSLRLLRSEPRLAAFLVVVALVGFASDPINTLAPAFAGEFGRPDTYAGLVIGVFGAGAVFAAIVLAGRVTGSRRRLAVTLALLGGGVVLFAITPWLPLALGVLFAAGFGYLASNTSATSQLLLGVEEDQRGRMMALWTVAFLGLRPFASLVDGLIANVYGVRAAGIALALPALAAAVLVTVSIRPRFTRRPRGRPSAPSEPARR